MAENRPRVMVIVGSAACAGEDLIRLAILHGVFPFPYDLAAVGIDALDMSGGEINYIVTNHQEDIPKIRKKMGELRNSKYKIISYYPGPEVDISESHSLPSGSSALTGALAAITLGYDHIVLCGCPLTGNAPEGNPYEAFRPGWEAKKDVLQGKVKSMSGWTRDLLGMPTKEWLAEIEKVTIGACWDGRDYYPVEYVNKLYRACFRNTTIPFDFVLYVGPEAERPGRIDDIDEAVKIIPVGLPYWWSGMKFWQKNPPGIETETILYLDIDQVIVGSLDDILRFPSEHACMKDYPSHACPRGNEGDINPSVTLIRNNAGIRVWEEYVKAGMPVWDPLNGRRGPLPMATQGIINDPRHKIKKDLLPENWVCSYKMEVRGYGLPEDCRIVSFHGRPKPHACMHEEFVKEHWR
jgi:hypothetical protein